MTQKLILQLDFLSSLGFIFFLNDVLQLMLPHVSHHSSSCNVTIHLTFKYIAIHILLSSYKSEPLSLVPVSSIIHSYFFFPTKIIWRNIAPSCKVNTGTKTRYDIDTVMDNGEVVEEEALSFSDLPVELDQKQQCKENEENFSDESESEFEFGLGFWSGSGSMSTKMLPEMCPANELFFQGKILPQRCCDSPDRSSMKNSSDEAIASPTGSLSRSHVVDNGSTSWVTSMSSRSSSKGSQLSSICGMTSNSSSFGSSCGTFSSVSNRFSSFPSPSPQTGFTGEKKHFMVPAGYKIRSKSQRDSPSLSSMWEFFRLGLVRKPDFERHNLKIRPNNNFNGCNKITNDSNDKDASMKKKKKKKGTVGFGFLGGCDCTADSVATHLALMNTGRKKSIVRSGKEEQLRWKLTESIGSDETRKMEQMTEKQRHTPQSSRHRRTFEWVK